MTKFETIIAPASNILPAGTKKIAELFGADPTGITDVYIYTDNNKVYIVDTGWYADNIYAANINGEKPLNVAKKIFSALKLKNYKLARQHPDEASFFQQYCQFFKGLEMDIKRM